MFNKHNDSKKSSFFPLIILRMCLSLVMLLILSVGLYQAFKHFAGVDPIKADPQAFLLSLVTEEGAVQVINTVFNFKVPSNLDELKRFINDPTGSDIGSQIAQITGGSGQRAVPGPGAKQVLTFAVVADSHNDNDGLKKALDSAKQKGAKFVIGLGDYTEVGAEKELMTARQVFLMSDLPYYLTAGDHDLWNARDKGESPISHYSQVFGSPYQSFGDSNIRFIIVYNSDNYQGVDDVQLSWLRGELNRVINDAPLATFVFTHEPLYHPSSDHVMGKVRADLKVQAELITQMLQESRVSEVFYGDTHFATSYQDPKSGLFMTAAGALTRERNAQKPRYLLVEVYDDGAYNLQDVEL